MTRAEDLLRTTGGSCKSHTHTSPQQTHHYDQHASHHHDKRSRSHKPTTAHSRAAGHQQLDESAESPCCCFVVAEEETSESCLGFLGNGCFWGNELSSFWICRLVGVRGLPWAQGLGLSGRHGTRLLWQSTSEGPVAGTHLAKKLTLRLTGSLSHQMQRDPLNCAIDPSRTGRQIPADFYSLAIRTRRRRQPGPLILLLGKNPKWVPRQNLMRSFRRKFADILRTVLGKVNGLRHILSRMLWSLSNMEPLRSPPGCKGFSKN